MSHHHHYHDHHGGGFLRSVFTLACVIVFINLLARVFLVALIVTASIVVLVGLSRFTRGFWRGLTGRHP